MDSQQIQADRDRVVRDALPGLTMGLAVLQAVIAVVHATVGTPAERPFVFVDGASAALAAGLRFALGKNPLPERWAHPFAAGCAAVAALIVLLHLRVLPTALRRSAVRNGDDGLGRRLREGQPDPLRDDGVFEGRDAHAHFRSIRPPRGPGCPPRGGPGIVRDDKGYWSQVEVYVRDRSEAEFSHDICPDCMKKLYGK